MPKNDILSRFEKVKKGAGENQFLAICPAHDDKTQSLSIGFKDGKVLMNCFAGCDNEDILQSVGLTWKDLNEDTEEREEREIIYPYKNIEGNTIHEKVRKPGKKFLQRHKVNDEYVWNLKGIDTILYNLKGLTEGIKQNKTIYLVEGEKDADLLINQGLIATTNTEGAGKGKFKSKYADTLQGAKLIVVMDNDRAGIESSETIARVVKDKVKSLKVLNWKLVDGCNIDKFDVGDYLKIHKIEEFIRLCDELPLYDEKEAPLWELNAKGQVLKTTNNIKTMLSICGYKVKFNILKNRIESFNKDGKFTDSNKLINNLQDEFQIRLNMNLSYEFIGKKLNEIAKHDKYNPFKDFLMECREDELNECGELKKLLNTLSCSEHKQDKKRFYEELIIKFLISIVSLNMTDESAEESPRFEGTLILKGEQGIGKTTWFRNLVPPGFFSEGKTIEGTKDNMMELSQYILVELGELEGITTKKDASFLKNELTRTYIEIRYPYDKEPTRKARRTLFCGTVNEDVFLLDSTGNRRYWVVDVGKIDHDTKIDLKKLWAEIIYLYEMGETWWLTKDEVIELNNSNKEYLAIGSLGLLFLSILDFEAKERYKYTLPDIFDFLGKPSNITPQKLGRELSKLGVEKKTEKIDGKATVVYYIPPPINFGEHGDYLNRMNPKSKIYTERINWHKIAEQRIEGNNILDFKKRL